MLFHYHAIVVQEEEKSLFQVINLSSAVGEFGLARWLVGWKVAGLRLYGSSVPHFIYSPGISKLFLFGLRFSQVTRYLLCSTDMTLKVLYADVICYFKQFFTCPEPLDVWEGGREGERGTGARARQCCHLLAAAILLHLTPSPSYTCLTSPIIHDRIELPA